MSTENLKVSGYVPKQVYEQLLKLKEQWEINSTSQILTLILQEYFGIDSHPNKLENSSLSLPQSLVALEERISRLEQQLIEVCELISKNFQVEQHIDIENNKRTEFGRRNSRIPKITPLVPHRNCDLADRLGVSKSTISAYKSRENFTEWSRSRDPEGIAWTYHPSTKLFNYCRYTVAETLRNELET
jgi:transcriptional regulator with XRE-family HTH domain